MLTENKIQDNLVKSVIKLSSKGPLLITIISIIASELIYFLLVLILGIEQNMVGLTASFLIPALVAYPSLSVITKVTKNVQEQNKDIEMKNNLKNTLLSVVSHDVKGPLINIDSLLELYFQNEIGKEELFDLMKELQLQVKTNLDFVMNILQWTKTQFDGFQVIKNPVELSQVISRIINAYQFQIQQKKISIETDVDLTANVDRDLMRLVLRNLLSNAIKFSELGGKIRISARIENEILITSVTDSGMGMSKDKLDGLFDESNLNSSKGTHQETGTGLGLKLCKTFIDALGGKIWAESESGKGSTFYFAIPQ